MTIALIFSIIFTFVSFIFTLLAFKSQNFVVRTIAMLMFFMASIASITYGPLVLGKPQEKVFLKIIHPDLNKVEVISYVFDQEDRKTVHFWLKAEGSNTIFYYIERNFKEPKKRELSQEGEKAKKQGQKLFMYLQGKPEGNGQKNDVGEEDKYDFEAENDMPVGPDPLKNIIQNNQPLIFN